MQIEHWITEVFSNDTNPGGGAGRDSKSAEIVRKIQKLEKRTAGRIFGLCHRRERGKDSI